MHDHTDYLLGPNLGKEWGWIALRGALAVIFGILAVAWPIITVWTLSMVWGVFALADGLFAFSTGWRLHKKGVRWWPYMALGVIGVLAGLIAVIWPGITAFVLVFIIGFWAALGGISQIIAAIRLRKEIDGEWFLILSGLLGLIFGLLLLFRPLEGAVAIAWIVGFYAIFMGILVIMLALKIRNAKNEHTTHSDGNA